MKLNCYICCCSGKPAVCNLHELKNTLLQSTGTDISTASICKLLHKNSFSHKKLAFRAQQRSDELRAKFVSEMTVYAPEMLIFINETVLTSVHLYVSMGML